MEPSVLDRLEEQLFPVELNQLLYVAYSALVTMNNLRKIDELGLHFVSRLPNNFSATASLRQDAWQVNEWIEIECLRQPAGRTGSGYLPYSSLRCTTPLPSHRKRRCGLKRRPALQAGSPGLSTARLLR